ncbi:MFS transporter [Pseudofrankia sp. DC12]|uniref:MFS transporter n=1 Tax=Pseudofrankia sp. DC12 TaxID=683315 RepID=UPI0005F87C67|nr:MFS transporter [Pseudofrankia sp. DC12]
MSVTADLSTSAPSHIPTTTAAPDRPAAAGRGERARPQPASVADASPESGGAAYRWLVSQPGTRPMMAAGLLARLPVAMIGVGGMLLVAASTGSYRLAGLTTAAVALAGAASGPAIGRRIDRLGPRAVLPVLAAAHVAAGIAFLAAAVVAAPVPVLLGTAVATGATLPQVGPVARQRWAARLPAGARLDAAYALESAIDEITFVTGPAAASALAGLTPSAGTAAALVLAAVGTAAFTALSGSAPAAGKSAVPDLSASPDRLALPASAGASAAGEPMAGPLPAGEPVVREPAPGERSMARIHGLVPLLASAAALGMFFGASDVALVAYGRAHGWGAASGLLPSTLTASNLCAGICYGMVRWRSSLPRRFAVAAGLFALTASVAPLAASVGGIDAVVVAVVIAGLPLTPLIISSTTIVGELVPAHRRTEGFGWTVIANGVGVAAGAPLAGALVDHAGATSALVVFPVCGCATGATALLAACRLSGRRHGAAGAGLPPPRRGG